MIRHLWPSVKLYAKQREIILAIRDTPEVYCKAGNKLGKDYIGGLIAVGAFLNPRAFLLNPLDQPPLLEAGVRIPSVKIVTTSVRDDHLDDLWGEIDRFINKCRFPLRVEDGGPLRVMKREIRRMLNGVELRDSYVKAEVSSKGEGRAGHHASYTLMMGDESSALDNDVYVYAQGWAKRMFFFGNPHDTENFWRKMCESGDLLAKVAAYEQAL